MKNCYNCGTPNDDNSMACQRCGAPLQMPQQVMQQQMQPQMMNQRMQPGYGMPQQQMQPQMMNQGMQSGYGMPQQQMQPQMMNQGMQPGYGMPQQGMQPGNGMPQQGMQPGNGMPQQQMQPQMMNQAPQQPTRSAAAPKKNKALVPIIIGVVAVIIIGIIIAVVLGGKDDKDDKDKKPSARQTKSYIANDISSSKTIKTAVETSMTRESSYELLTNYLEGEGTVIVVTPDVATEEIGQGVNIISSNKGPDYEYAKIEIGKNIGEKTPPIKYNYDVLTEEKADLVYYVYVSDKGSVYVYIGEKGLEDEIFDAASSGDVEANGEDGYYSICPEICDAYLDATGW